MSWWNVLEMGSPSWVNKYGSASCLHSSSILLCGGPKWEVLLNPPPPPSGSFERAASIAQRHWSVERISDQMLSHHISWKATTMVGPSKFTWSPATFAMLLMQSPHANSMPHVFDSQFGQQPNDVPCWCSKEHDHRGKKESKVEKKNHFSWCRAFTEWR